MPRKIYAYVAIVMLVVFTSAIFAHSTKALTNKDIVTMVKGGVAPQTIIEIIKQSECQFDISPEAMIALKQEGVPDVVIHAMAAKNNPSNTEQTQSLSDSSELSGRGVTFIDGSTKVQMKRAMSSGNRTGGIGMKMVNPFGKVKALQTFNGNHSQLRTNNISPTFEVWAPADMNPSDAIQIIKFNVKSDRREISIGSGRIGFSTGFSKDDLMPLTFDEGKENSPGGYQKLYRVTLVKPLSLGEYALVLQGTTYYDFGVDSSK